MSMLKLVKAAARQTDEAASPADWFFAVVVSPKPVKLFVDNRFYIEEDGTDATQLVVPLIFQKDREVNTHTHYTKPHFHGLLTHEAAGDSSPAPPPSLAGTLRATDQTELTTAKEREVYTGLQAGDKVALLRKRGGAQFLLLGRI